jgi:ABC-type sugar transport system permease subunit
MIPGRRTQDRAAWWFLLPALIFLAIFVVWPLLRAAAWSFTNADLLAPEDSRWTGLSNYADLLRDPRFRQAFGNTALFALMVVPLQTFIAVVARRLFRASGRIDAGAGGVVDHAVSTDAGR